MGNIYDQLIDAPAATSPAQSTPSQYDDLIESDLNTQRQQFKSTMMTAIGANPQSAAKAHRVAKATGVPFDTAERNTAELENTVKLQEIQRLAAQNPVLAKQLTDPVFAKMSHQDAVNLSGFEGTFKTLWNDVIKPTPARAMSAYQQGVGGMYQWIGEAAVQPVINAFTSEETRKKYGSSNILTNFGIVLRDDARFVDEYLQKEHPLDPNSWAGASASALQSMYLQAPFMAIGSLAGTARNATATTLGLMGLTTGGQTYGERRERGFSPAASGLSAALDATVEVGTELMPMGTLFDMMKPAAKHSFGRLAGKMVELYGQEMGGELVATLFQDLNNKFMTDPNMTLKERVDQMGQYFSSGEAMQNAINTLKSTAVQTTLMGGAGVGINRLQQGRLAREQAQHQLLVDALTKAELSQLKSESPDTFAQFAQNTAEHYGAPTIYFQADKLIAAAVQQGLTEQQIPEYLAQYGVTESQLQEAVHTGGLIGLETGKFATYFQNDPVLQSLQNDFVIDPNAHSRSEAENGVQLDMETMKHLNELYQADQSHKINQDDIAAWEEAILNTPGLKGNVTMDSLMPIIERANLMSQATGVPAIEHLNRLLRPTGLQVMKFADYEARKQAAQGQELEQSPASRTGNETYSIRKTAAEGMLAPAVLKDGKILAAGIGATHYDVHTEVGQAEGREDANGFVTPDGKFLDRKESLQWLKENRPDVYRALDKETKQNGLESQAYAHAEGLGGDLADEAQRYMESLGLFQTSPFDGKEVATTPITEGVTEIDVDGVTRPALSSNGKPIHWSEEGIRNFWRWFGDSKVVDEQGRPLVVYHGTRADFDTFKKRIFDGPIFFSTSTEFAGEYAGDVESKAKIEQFRKGRPSVVPAYLSIQKIFDYRNTKDVDGVVNTLPAAEYPEDIKKVIAAEIKQGAWNRIESLDMQEAMQKAGYDGFTILEYDDSDNPTLNYGVFEPTQIKSATGNSGAFGKDEPSILFQSVDEYGGQHRPPGVDDGAPLHDMTGGGEMYPGDIYSNKALHLYGTGQDRADKESMAVIQATKDKPNATVTIYRAVPKEPTNAEQIAKLEKEKAAYLKRGKVPSDSPFSSGSKWYEWASDEIERLQSAEENTAANIKDINAGDWITLSKTYAKEHGEAVLNGKYKIISKKVKASELFTNGDSINELGYWPNTKESMTLYQSAWHGSPHTFDKFSTSAIGTGEGAQAYGYGLYFAGAREVAEYYKKVLSAQKGVLELDGQPLNDSQNEQFREIAKIVQERLSNLSSPGVDDIEDAIKSLPASEAKNRLIDQWKRGRLKTSEGRLYKVELAPAEDEYLLWDKPLSEQSEKVKEALEGVKDKFSKSGGALSETDQLLSDLLDLNWSEESGVAVYKDMSKQLGSDRAASEYLHSLGIRGIKYEDGNTRNKDEKQYNYVIFSDDDVAITEMYQKQQAMNNPLGALNTANGQNLVTLFEGADKSTFLHETAHIFLNDLRYVAETYGVQQKEWEAVKAWLGVKTKWAGTRLTSIDEIHKIVAGKTEKKGGIDPRQLLSRQPKPGFEYRIGEVKLSEFSENEEGDLYDGTVNRGIATEYANRKTQAPPVIAVTNRINGKLNIIDGGHRITAARMLGKKTIYAVIEVPVEKTDFTREQHEMFAEHFEKYLMEGKAPSIELRNAFRSFKRWLTKIYERIESYRKGQRDNVTVSPELAELFGRLMATEQQIQAAREHDALVGMLDANMMADVGDSQSMIDEYRKLLAQSDDSAREKMDKHKLVGSEQRKTEFRKQAQEEVKTIPVYAFVDKVVAEGGINRQSVEAILGKENTPNLPHLWRNDGLDVNVAVAEHGAEHGFNSAGDLAAALQQMKPRQLWVDKRVAQLEAIHDTTLDSQEAIRTAALRRMLEIESEWLAKRAVKQTVTPRATMRAWADKTIAGRTMREINNVGKLLAESRKHRQQAILEARQGKWEEALAANEKARLTEELIAASYRAIKTNKAIESNVNKVKNATRVKSGKAAKVGESWRKQIDRLLDQYGIAKRDYDPAMSNLHDFAASKIDDFDGTGAALPAWIGTEVNDFNKLTFEQRQEFNDALKYLYGNGRDEVRGRKLANGEAVADKAAEIAARQDGIKNKPELMSDATAAGRVIQKVQKNYRKFFANTGILRFIAKRMDGYSKEMGPAEQLVQDIINGMAASNDMWVAIQKEVEPALQILMKDGDKVFSDITWPELLRNEGASWNKARVVAAALNMGNDSNMMKLLDGYGLTQDDASNIASKLTAEEWQAIQKIWDTVDSLWPQIADVHERLKYFRPKKIEARAMTITTADDQQITLKGGYYPIKYDARFTRKIAEWSEKDDLLASHEAIMQVPAAKSGFSKERTGVAYPVDLSLNVLAGHFNDTIRFITLAEKVRDADRVFRNDTLMTRNLETLGRDMVNMIRPTLKQVIRPEASKVSPWFERSRVAMSMYYMGYNAWTAIQNITGVFPAIKQAGAANYMNGIMHVIANPLAAHKAMLEASSYMRLRSANVERDMKKHLREFNIGGMEINGKRYTYDDVKSLGFAGIRLIDGVVALPAWWGKYNTEMELHGDVKKATEAADAAINNALGSGLAIDSTGFQRHPFLSLLAPFMSFASTQQEVLATERQAWKEGKIGNAEFLYGHLMTWVAPAIMSTFLQGMLMYGIAGALGGGDDDKKKKDWSDYIGDLISYRLMGIPFLRDVFNGVKQGFDNKAPVTSARMPVTEGFKMVQQLGYRVGNLDGSEKKTKAAMWSAAELASLASGVPATRIYERWQKGTKQIENGSGWWGNHFVPQEKKK